MQQADTESTTLEEGLETCVPKNPTAAASGGDDQEDDRCSLGSFADEGECSDFTEFESMSYYPESDYDNDNDRDLGHQEETVTQPIPPVPAESVVISAADGEPSAKRQKTLEATNRSNQQVETHESRIGRIRQYSSPESILKEISPLPGCMLSLNYNDWRWVSKWRKGVTCDQWIDELVNKSYSQTFTLSNWKEKLSAVHSHAWTKWELSQPFVDVLRLPDGASAQTTGVIPQHIVDALAPIMENMPVKKKYSKLCTGSE